MYKSLLGYIVLQFISLTYSKAKMGLVETQSGQVDSVRKY